ncbi:hypothetical protein FFF34_009675 [Inquilinus sp. KBS0705]|nr:hypothetical protein FFF34_009675 [Inquilinus sp. KBS0705]
MDLTLMPTKPGQIVKIISDVPDLELSEVYIVSEDPLEIADDDEVTVVSLKELQRNIRNPDHAERIFVRKNQLVVVSEDLTSHVQSWNAKGI